MTRSASAPLKIGLVNSMPGEARKATEQQFRAILAATGQPVELRLLSLADISHLDSDIPDALIVTGMPPRAGPLSEEPHWRDLTELVDFASDNAIPTVWSCLAAHAAVLYLDGIERRRLPQKLSGVFDCVRTDVTHPLLSGLPKQWRIPHSRWNELPESDLVAGGYRILSRSAAGGVDIFVKDAGAQFLFCQGHPEYDAQTLLREYRRDIRQFLSGERDTYPEMPHGYFGPDVTLLLAAFQQRALRERTIETMPAFPTAACAADVRHAWQGLAIGLYANWLSLIAGQMARPETMTDLKMGIDA
jgi:homoserine O-succinyltransferase